MNTLGLVPPIIWGLAVIGLRYGLYYNTLKAYKRRIESLTGEMDEIKTNCLQQLNGLDNPNAGNIKQVLSEPAAHVVFNRELETNLTGQFQRQGLEVPLSVMAFGRTASALRTQIIAYNRLALGKYDKRTAQLLGFRPIAVPG
jgi:hypothetical protein